MAVEWVARLEKLAGVAVIDGEDTDIGVTELAGEAHAVLGVHDIAGVDEVNGRGKVGRVFKEEGAQLRGSKQGSAD